MTKIKGSALLRVLQRQGREPLHAQQSLSVLNFAPNSWVSGFDGKQVRGIGIQTAAAYVGLARVMVGKSLQAPGAEMTATATNDSSIR